MRHLRRLTTALAVLAMAGASLATAVPASAANGGLIVWVDPGRVASVTTAIGPTFRGKPVTVVSKEMNAIKAELATVPEAERPDIIWADNAWTGELVASGQVVAVPLSAKKIAQFPSAALNGFRIGASTYGVPVQYENVALITNAALVPNPPKTFAELEKVALKLKKQGKVTVPFAVGQGEAGNAYFMTPLFTGLGGYMFGSDATGSLDPANVGIASTAFKANSARINKWNTNGLINSTLDIAAAEKAFVEGKAPFWITGQWSTTTLKRLPFRYYVSPVPSIVSGIKVSPYVGAKGFMVTVYADQHGRGDDAQRLVRNRLMEPARQAAIAAVSGRVPAVTGAAMDKLAEAFKTAAKDGVPMPNIPEATTAWGPLGRAWASSTKGKGATKAKKAFTAAQTEVVGALGIPASDAGNADVLSPAG